MTAEEKLEVLRDWAKSVEKLLELDGQIEVDVVEKDQSVDVRIKFKSQSK